MPFPFLNLYAIMALIKNEFNHSIKISLIIIIIPFIYILLIRAEINQ